MKIYEAKLCGKTGFALSIENIIKELEMRKDDLESCMEFKMIRENEEVMEGLRVDVERISKSIELLKDVK